MRIHYFVTTDTNPRIFLPIPHLLFLIRHNVCHYTREIKIFKLNLHFWKTYNYSHCVKELLNKDD